MQTPNIAEVVLGGSVPAHDDPSETFFEASKLHRSLGAVEVPGVYLLESAPWLVEATARAGKRFDHRPLLPLPRDPGRAADLVSTLERRRTPRGFASGATADLATLATWLWAADGASHPVSAHHTGRTAPSGGALFPRDLFVAVAGVDGVAPGLHHYDPDRHLLAHVSDVTPAELATTTPQPEAFDGCLAVLVITAAFWRSRFKYGHRAVRFALMEAGHVAQNALLAAVATGHAAHLIGGFYDDDLADLVGCDGVHEAPLAMVLIGSPQERGDDAGR